MVEQQLTEPEGLLVTPDNPCGTGVLVLAGSSGRVDADRARRLARSGAVAMALRWFGGPGQQPGPYDVPLETFVTAIDRLAAPPRASGWPWSARRSGPRRRCSPPSMTSG